MHPYGPQIICISQATEFLSVPCAEVNIATIPY